MTLDPLIHAYRSDIADIALAGQIFAPHYARPLLRAATGAVEVRRAAANEADAIEKLAPDALFAVLEYAGGWAWGYTQTSHLVGYVPSEALHDPA